MDVTQVKLYILENEDEKPRYARMRCEGVATLGQFRAFLEKKPSPIPWPFDFYDAEEKCIIATEWEQSSHLECYDHKVTVIRSDDRQAMEKKRKRVDEEPMALLEPTTVKEVIQPASTSYTEAPVASASTSAAPYEDLNEQKETSCPKLDPKHKVFLSHSGKQKPFVQKFCKLLEQHNYNPFFDQRPDSLPKGKKFSELIIEAAKTCQVAVVVLSEDYLSSKWPMIELEKFVWARKSENKNLNLLPLFYKASVDDLDDTSIKNKWMPKWIELARVDSRVDPEKWAEAVRELRGANGIKFCRSENKDEDEDEESYCDAIVEAIFMLAAPDLLYDMSNIHGGDRICKILADRFQRHPKTSASVLGLYGTGGLGKTTISKCLCNHFTQEFLGRVCYIEMKEGVGELVRQQVVMRNLLRLGERMMQKISDASEGWDLLKKRMKENPVLLIIDNVQPGEEEEARNYLNIEYNSLSKIMVVARSLDVVGKLLGGRSYCYVIPCLEKEEAVGILLQHGGQNREYHSLSEEEQGIVEGCVEEACFRDHDGTQNTSLHGSGGGRYHPLAINALEAYLEERSESSRVLLWATYLDEFRELKGSGECYDKLFMILGLQFSTLDRMKHLMYLDIVLNAPLALASPVHSNSRLEDMEMWLANIHDVPRVVVKHWIAYFRKSDMLHVEGEEIIIHDLYKDYAKWALKHVVNSGGLVSVWCHELNRSWKLQDEPWLFQNQIQYSKIPKELQCSPSGSCWQELRRICLGFIPFLELGVRRFQEWQNVVVLQLIQCDHVSTLNLQGLTCLRHLELRFFKDLQTLFLTEYESTFPDIVLQASCMEPKPRPWLQYVIVDCLSSLKYLPSFSPSTSLKYLEVVKCGELREPPMAQHCVHLRRMQLHWYPGQKTFPNLDGLTSLQDLTIRGYLVERGFRALKLEGLSSLTSLGALELRNIPVGDLNGLEKLPNVEFIHVHGMYLLEDLPPLERLARSSLHLLEVYVSDEHKKRLEKLQWLISQKLERLRAQGERVAHFPSKIGPVPSSGGVFLSYSEVEKHFVAKLCMHYPFFDKRPYSLLKGKKFADPIIEVAKMCEVAVVVLSEDYLSSKWLMMELAEFVWARKSSNKNLNLLPLFYKASVANLDDTSIKDKWMPKWIELARADPRVDPEKWAEAVRELRGANGIEFRRFENDGSYRGAIVKAIFMLTDLPYDMSNIYGRNRMCKILADKFQRHPKTRASVLGLYGMGGLGKTTISKCLCNHFTQEFLGRVCYIEMKEGVGELVRQKVVMRKLLRLGERMMQEIMDASQGWDILKKRMKENPGLLIIDNVQPDEEEEALKYFNIEHNSLSKIMVVSRSLDVVGKVLGYRSYCWEIPRLEKEEVVDILLQYGGQNRENHTVSEEERGIAEGFVEEAYFRDYDVTQTT